MSNDLWRWADPDGQQRKVRFDELRAALAGGLIAPNTPVWRSGWPRWQPAHEVPELTSASVGGANGVVLNIPPPPLAMLAVQHEYEATSGSIAPSPPSITPAGPNDEPPPPPHYVPLPVKAPSISPGPSSSQQLKTQMGGSAHIPAAAPRALGPSLPTTIGVPPPPEAMGLGQIGNRTQPMGQSQPPPPVNRSAPPPPPPRKPAAGGEMIEELSGSMLLDSSPNNVGGGDQSSRPSNNGMFGGLPPPTDPIVNDIVVNPLDPNGGMDEIAGLPRRPGLSVIFEDIKGGVAEIKQGRPPKNKALFAVLGIVSFSVLIMLIAGIVSLASGPSASDKAKAAASASAALSAAAAPPSVTPSAGPVSTAPPATAAAIPPPEDPKPSGPMLGDCTTAGDAKTIAPRAVIQSGIEAHALGSGLAFGSAPSARDALATSLDPSSLTPTASARTKPIGGDAKRVTPLLVGGKLAALPDVDRKGDRLSGRRIVPASTLIDVGFADGGIVWAPHGKDSYAKLFAVEGDGANEALRAIPLTHHKGIAVAFRKGNAIHVGAAKGDSVLEAEGELSKITGLGQVGSPAIAASGDQLVVAWADRAGASDEWQVRWTKIKIGGSTAEATPFTIPEGGLGGQAMSPSVASLGGGKFLLAWTEGPVSNHQVRAITIGPDGSPSGAAIAISASGVNAGQPAAVVAADGRGAVAFLAAKGKALELHATPINCAAAK